MSIEKLSEELSQEKSEIESALQESKQRAQELTKQLERVEASLAALQGKPTRKRTRKKATTRKVVTSSPQATVDTVRSLVVEILRQSGAMDEAALEEQVAGRLNEQQQPTGGLHEVLKEALCTQQFENTLSGWKLVEIRLEAACATTE